MPSAAHYGCPAACDCMFGLEEEVTKLWAYTYLQAVANGLVGKSKNLRTKLENL